MHYQPHVGLVDAHAEGAGGDDDVNPILKEIIQSDPTQQLAQTGVVGSRPVPRFTQGAGNCLGAPSGGGVHDGHDVVAVEQPKQRRQTLPLALHPHSPEPQVGPIEGAQMQRVAFTKPKAPGNLARTPGVALPVNAIACGVPNR